MKSCVYTFTILAALLAAPAPAQEVNTNALILARKAVAHNTPKDALLSGSTPLSSHPMFQQVFKRLDFNKINEQAAVLMAQTFSEAEIQALLNFMESPAGQQIGLKMPGYQMLVGAMLQNEMKATFEGLVLSQGVQNQQNQRSGMGTPGLTGFTPLPGAR